MATGPLKSDGPWFECLYLLLDCWCEGCGENPDPLRALWEADDLPSGEDGAEVWCSRAAEFLMAAGWKVIDQAPYGPKCAVKRSN
jgi:hypothetical protein